MNYVQDLYVKHFKERNSILDFLKVRSDKSIWLTAKVKDLNFNTLANGPMFINQNRLDLKLGECISEEAIEDTQKSGAINNSGGSQFGVVVDGRGYLLSDVALNCVGTSLIGAISSFNKLSKAKQKDALDIFAMASPEKHLKMFYSGEKIRAIQSSKYAPLDQYALACALFTKLDKEFGEEKINFIHGEYTHEQTNFGLLIDSVDILNDYKDACSIFDKESVAMDAKPYVLFNTSDSGNAAAKVRVGLTDGHIFVGDAVSVEHLTGRTVETFEGEMENIFIRYSHFLGKLEKLLSVEIKYPLTCLKNLLTSAGFADKYVNIGLERFNSVYDKSMYVSAHMLFFFAQEVLSDMKNDEVADRTLVRVGENLMRSLNENWATYDKLA